MKNWPLPHQAYLKIYFRSLPISTRSPTLARFLHIADIHLGFDRYNNKARTKDFYFALADVLDRYAIPAQVDFVIICGDLFEQRMIQPAVLN